MKRQLIYLQSDSSKTIETAFEEFQLFNESKNLAEDTIKYYNQCYIHLSKFFDAYEKGDISIKDDCSIITQNLVYDYISRMKKCGVKDVSINSNLRGLRAMVNYFIEQGYLYNVKVRLIKEDETIKEPYSEAEIKILLKKPNIKKCSFAEYRNWVAINYFLGTGNRIRTVINVKTKDIDFDNGFITLTKTKNRKLQIIPLSSTLAVILKEYLKYRKGNPDDYLFCNQYGGQMTRSSLYSSIREYNLKRGVKKTSVHLFRHLFAKDWVVSEGGESKLQRLLGHSSPAMVQKYVRMYGKDLKVNFNEHNSLEKYSDSSGHISMR